MKKEVSGKINLDPKVVLVTPLKSPAEIPLALTYDDVLLKPKRSRLRSRKDAATSTRLTKNISLNIPIVSANMDTVTESEMAVALAKMGGIGIIHRFMPVEEQVREILAVKSPQTKSKKDLLTIKKDETLAAAWRLMDKYDVSSLLVVDAEGKLLGILTSRDIIFESDPRRAVGDLMTAGKDLITASLGTTYEEAKKIFSDAKIEKLPLIDKAGRLKGLITASDVIKEREFPNASRDEGGKFLVGAAIGVRGDYQERAEALVDAGADVLVLDIAHGHSDSAVEAVRWLKHHMKCDVIAGNVATAAGTRELALAGADGIKVGVGPGSACTTRIVAGVGVPQFSAVLECAKVSAALNVPVIADGGIRASGDIVKALAAGASSVMLGNLLAGCIECPGEEVTRDGKKFKVYRGMASSGAANARLNLDKTSAEDEWFNRAVVPEGVEATVPLKGSAIELIYQLVGGLRSGMSYLNAVDLTELSEHAEFIQVTGAGQTESKPHDIDVSGTI